MIDRTESIVATGRLLVGGERDGSELTLPSCRRKGAVLDISPISRRYEVCRSLCEVGIRRLRRRG